MYVDVWILIVCAWFLITVGIVWGWRAARRHANQEIERELKRALATPVVFGSDPISMAGRLECDLAEIHRYFAGKFQLHLARGENREAAGTAVMARRVHGTWVVANTLLQTLTKEARERWTSSSKLNT
ncbi:MAG: hypothetical protein ACM3US_09920 [Sphingomonadaceae bacterium]